MICGDIFVSISVQAHLLFHRFDLIACGIDEISSAVQFLLIDFKFAEVLLNDRCLYVKEILDILFVVLGKNAIKKIVRCKMVNAF